MINYEYKWNTIHYNYDINRYRAPVPKYDTNILRYSLKNIIFILGQPYNMES
jgi:hypothetical protein